MWIQKHVFPTDGFGTCVVLAKLSYCPRWCVLLVSLCAPVFVFFAVWFSLEKPARQTSFFINNSFPALVQVQWGKKILYKKLGLDEDDFF